MHGILLSTVDQGIPGKVSFTVYHPISVNTVYWSMVYRLLAVG